MKYKSVNWLNYAIIKYIQLQQITVYLDAHTCYLLQTTCITKALSDSNHMYNIITCTFLTDV